MEKRQQLVHRPAVEAYHQPGEDQRYRRQAFAPGDAKDQRAYGAGAKQGGKLRGRHAGDRPQGGDGNAQLRTGRDPQRGRLCQRVTQYLLEQHAHQPQSGPNQQGDRQPGKQAVVENHLGNDIHIRVPDRLRPLIARQRLGEIHPGQPGGDEKEDRQQQRGKRRDTLAHALPPRALSRTRTKCITDSVAP